MKNAQVKRKVVSLLSSGVGKSETFLNLSGSGVKASQLALWIASYPIPERCEEHKGKIKVLIAIMFLQAAFALLIGFDLGSKIGPNARWIVAGLLAFIPLLFAWGFLKNVAGAYGAYIFLSILQVPKQLEEFATNPLFAALGLAISIGLIFYVW